MGDAIPVTVAAYGLLLAVGVTSGLGDVLLYRWTRSGLHIWLFGSYALWLLSVTLLGWFMMWHRSAFSTAVILATVVHLAVGVAWDLLFLGGRLNKVEWLGLACAVLAVILLELGRHHHSPHDPGS